MKNQGKRSISILLAVILALQMVFVSGGAALADEETPVVTPTDADIYGVSLVLSGEIGLTFHVKVNRAYRNGTIKLEIIDKEDIAPIIMNIPYCPSDGLNCYKVTYYLNAVELSEQVTITVLDADNKMLAQKSYSAEEYVSHLLKDEEATEAEKNIGRKLINYGHYAQLACSEANGWEIGEDYAETDAYDEPIIDTSVFDDYKIEWQNCSDKLKKILISLRLDYKTAIHLYFPLDEKPTVTVNGKEVDAAESERVEDCYEVSIDGINALNLEKEYEVTVNDVTFTLSAFSYCKEVISQSVSDNVVDALRALYEFYQAIVAYNALEVE